MIRNEEIGRAIDPARKELSGLTDQGQEKRAQVEKLNSELTSLRDFMEAERGRLIAEARTAASGEAEHIRSMARKQMDIAVQAMRAQVASELDLERKRVQGELDSDRAQLSRT